MPQGDSHSCPKIVGHAGGGALAPRNTIAGILAGLAAGVDVVELDVRRASPHRTLLDRLRRRAAGPRPAGLVLAHDQHQARPGRALAFDEALSFLARSSPRSTELLIDLKADDIEEEVVAALDLAGLTERAIVCAGSVDILRRLRQGHREVRRAWSVENSRQAAAAGLGPDERDAPGHAAAAVRQGLAELLSVHRSLATPAFIDAVHDAGGLVYAWDVNRRRDAEALVAAGVDGLIGDDPLLLRSACDDSSPAPWTSN
ncbi:MAG TPA: glycerophosphodiester phosphodiesterase [Solirubrobacteraceae bacterium]|nr:glycerophosphodiester phosphodiesterase [Solirubrobacteraceae bacterium]